MSTVARAPRYTFMRRRRFIPYRHDLTSRARSLRRDATSAERKLWYEFLRTHNIKFTRQKPLGSYVADFYCASRLLVIELDGDSHFTVRAQRYDQSRTDALAQQGIRVLRFTNLDVSENFEAVCARIDEALDT